jgi:hypothetical protein
MKCVLVIILYFICALSYSQTDSLKTKDGANEIEQRVENLAEGVDNASADYTTLLDNLIYFSEHQLNINSASADDLKELGLLTDIQINSILNHIKNNGSLLNIYELQGIDEIDIQTIQKILPYIKIEDRFYNPNLSLSEIKKYGSHQLISRWSRTLESQQGYTPISDSAYALSPNSRYLGSPDNLFLRYRFNYANFFSVGFAAEKDAGEAFLNTKTRTGNAKSDSILNSKLKPGFDFYTFHAFARNIWKFKQVALGDYQVSIGQGAVFSNGLAFGKTADILSIKRNAFGLKPYTSVNPSLLMRGAAFNLAIGKFEVLAWTSSKKIDGNVTSLINDSTNNDLGNAGFEGVNISSVQISGFHRTPNELADKSSIKETILGSRISYNSKNLSFGLTGVNTQFSGNFSPNSTVYNKYDFSGNQNFNIGMDYNWIIRNFNFYGEVGRSKNGGMAIVSGALISLDPKLTFVIHYRNFQKNYQALNANALSENTIKQNEVGLYNGLYFKPNNYFSATAYMDVSRYPWLKYQVSSPSQGYDLFSQLNYTPTKKISSYLRFRQRITQRDFSDEYEEIRYLNNIQQRNYRFETSYPLSNSFSSKQRIEITEYKPQYGNHEFGYYIFNDISYKALSSPIQLTWRYGLFETQGYNSRIYSYEKEVLYAYSIPAINGKGIRTYLMARYTIIRGLDLWLRIAATFYDNQTQTGSALNLINTNRKTDIRVQLRYKF